MAQETLPRGGVYEERPSLVAFTNATVYTNYRTRLGKVTFLIRRGKVEGVGQDLSIPTGAGVVDLQGKHIFPGFVDLFSDYRMPWPLTPPSSCPVGGAASGKGGETAYRLSQRPGATARLNPDA